MKPTYILGGTQTDFAETWSDIQALLVWVVSGALDSAGVDPADIEVAHVGNLASELITGQAHLGAVVAQADPALYGLPTSRHEAACASGSVALLSAMAEIEAGRYDVALVAGVEVLRTVGGEEAGRALGCARSVGHEADDERFPWPYLFNRVADEYDRRYGLDDNHLARIAELNLAHARQNPLAQTRDWVIDPGAPRARDERNPVVEGHLRKWDCGRITDGAAAIVVAGPNYASAHARRHGRDLSELPVIAGWGHRTAALTLEAKLDRSADEPYVFPHIRQAAMDAYRRAGIEGPGDLDVIEVHDCFTISEYVAIDHLGITGAGRSGEAIEAGLIDMESDLPINPSGGLLGLGHPVGATGVRMALDAAKQVSGTAGTYQVDGARRAATLNIGGSFTSVVSFIVEAPQPRG